MTGLLEPSTRPTFLMPPSAYFDRDWYEREQRQLFGRNYNLVGYLADIPAPGDYLVARVGNDPVIVVRTADGDVRSYLNMCRHRGMAIACAPGHTDGNLRCPYHGWEFDFDGALARVPQRKTQFPDIDVDELGLFPLATGTWAGLIFVNPSADAPSFEEWFGDFGAADKAGPFDFDSLVEVDRIDIPLRCNWKFYIENHIDILHLWYLHEESLSMFDHHALTCWKSGLHWGCVEPLHPGRERLREGLTPISNLPDEERSLLRANLIFPNVPYSTTESSVTTYQVIPTGPETCRLDLRVRGEPGSELQDRSDILKVLRDEDGFACEQMQEVVHSPRFEVGPIAFEHELPIHQFHRDVLSFV
jgi:phenylpropionate dioxygenase-like ring-hydroxylating dioxygenase large terminal subunit